VDAGQLPAGYWVQAETVVKKADAWAAEFIFNTDVQDSAGQAFDAHQGDNNQKALETRK